MNKTPEEWLSYLTAKMDKARTRTDLLRSYTNGTSPLPEMGPNLAKAWIKFQRRARTSPGKLVVAALVDRLIPNGVTVGASDKTPAALAAARIWRDNRLKVAFSDAIWDAATLGHGYLLVTQDEDGHACVTYERPEHMYVEPDPVRPWRALAAVKVWRDSAAGIDHLVMWTPGKRTSFSRSAYSDSKALISTVSSGWRQDEAGEQSFEGAPPVVVLENRFGEGEFENVLDLIDRINWQTLQRLVIISMQAFRQRALKSAEGSAGLPAEDEAGNEIDYQKVFEPSPAALWELPPGVEIWESSQTQITEILNATKDDWRELAVETSTPLSIMLPDSANQSASGAEQPQKALLSKAEDRIERFKPALAYLMVRALAVEGIDLDEAETVEVLFVPPHAVSLTEKYAAAVQARNAGEALETIQRNILGYSPEQIAQDKQRRAEEQLALAFALQDNPQPTDEAQPPVTGGDPSELKTKFDALGTAIRAGVAPESAAQVVGLDGIKFTGAVPVALRLPETQSADLEEK